MGGGGRRGTTTNSGVWGRSEMDGAVLQGEGQPGWVEVGSGWLGVRKRPWLLSEEGGHLGVRTGWRRVRTELGTQSEVGDGDDAETRIPERGRGTFPFVFFPPFTSGLL